MHTQSKLQEISGNALRQANALGATDAVIGIIESEALSVSVRRGAVETIERQRDKGINVSVFVGRRSGMASTSEFSPVAVRDAIAAAHHVARFTSEDDAAGPAEAELLETAPPDLDLYHPWT